MVLLPQPPSDWKYRLMLPGLASVFSLWLLALIMWAMHDSKLLVTQDDL